MKNEIHNHTIPDNTSNGYQEKHELVLVLFLTPYKPRNSHHSFTCSSSLWFNLWFCLRKPAQVKHKRTSNNQISQYPKSPGHLFCLFDSKHHLKALRSSLSAKDFRKLNSLAVTLLRSSPRRSAMDKKTSHSS